MTNIHISIKPSSIAPYRDLNTAFIKLADLGVYIHEQNDGSYVYALSARRSDGDTLRAAEGYGGGLDARDLHSAIGEAIVKVADLTSDPHGDFWRTVRERANVAPEFDFDATLGDLMKKDA